MQSLRNRWWIGSVFVVGLWLVVGCYSTPSDLSEHGRGPTPLRTPSPAKECESGSYEDSLTGGQVFNMYCGYCHNAPSLAERPYAQFRNVAAHMRVRANLTGKEYAKVMEFLRRWNDVPPPNPPMPPSPTRLTFSQPIAELKPAEPKPEGPPMPVKPPEGESKKEPELQP